jgi:hypothetical protein
MLLKAKSIAYVYLKAGRRRARSEIIRSMALALQAKGMQPSGM